MALASVAVEVNSSVALPDSIRYHKEDSPSHSSVSISPSGMSDTGGARSL